MQSCGRICAPSTHTGTQKDALRNLFLLGDPNPDLSYHFPALSRENTHTHQMVLVCWEAVSMSPGSHAQRLEGPVQKLLRRQGKDLTLSFQQVTRGLDIPSVGTIRVPDVAGC